MTDRPEAPQAGEPPRVRAARYLAWALPLLVALAVRLAFVQLPQPPLIGDAEDHFDASRSLAAGELTSRMNNVLRLRGPGYPLFLTAMFRLLGADPAPIYLAQALLGAFLCFPVYGLAELAAGRRAAAIAAWIVALYPPLVWHTGLLLTETLALALFWGGLYLLQKGVAASHGSLMAIGSVCASLACLTRPNLVPAVPLLIGAIWAGSAAASRVVRILRTAVVAAGLLVPLVAWNVYLGRSGLVPVAGADGARLTWNYVRQATHPEYRGWLPNVPPASVPDWSPVLDEAPWYPLAGAANLVFHELWFTDNLWRQSLALSPTQIDRLHRTILFLAVGGAGLALLAWRRHAVLLAVVAAALASSVIRWIETRHLIPFLPAFFVLAGLFVARTVDDLPPRLRWMLLAGGGSLAALGLGLESATPLGLGRWLPFAALATLGRASDLVAMVLIAGWGVMIVRAWRERLGTRRAAITAAPAVALAALFGAYVIVGSGPRWHEWTIAGWAPGCRVARTVQPATPFPRSVSAAWLVDLASTADPPELAAHLDEAPLHASRWRRSLCPAVDSYTCTVYATFAGHAGPPLAARRQWWRIEVDPERVAGAPALRLTLEPRAAAGITLGGIVRNGGRTRALAPSIDNARASIFRWVVLEDWRRWEHARLESAAVSAEIGGSCSPPRLARAVAAGEAEPLIRLVLEMADGRQLVY